MLYACREMASICLQLFRAGIAQSRCPSCEGSSYEVATRPLLQDMNDLSTSSDYTEYPAPTQRPDAPVFLLMADTSSGGCS